jgi:quinol monooxygenase YgiN
MLFGMHGRMMAMPGKRAALVAQMMRAAELMRGVPGCLLYLVSTSASDPDDIWVTEIWRDEAAHGASLSMPGVRDLVKETMPLLAGAPEGTRFTPVGGKGLDRLQG